MSSLARAEAGANAAGGFVYGLLLVNGTLIAGMYAFAKVAGEHGITQLGPLTLQLLLAANEIGLAGGEGGGRGERRVAPPRVPVPGQAECAGGAGPTTPFPGGVGPMTIACLLQNTVTAAKIQYGIKD